MPNQNQSVNYQELIRKLNYRDNQSFLTLIQTQKQLTQNIQDQNQTNACLKNNSSLNKSTLTNP